MLSIIRSLPPLVSVLLLTLSLCFNSAHAEIDTEAGSVCAPATNGTPGDPGTPGTAGGAGGDATATAISTEPTNTATANGANGCAGGNGGAGTPSGANGGAGGNGGDGGDASATAQTTVSSGSGSATATADGGNGGAGGTGGSASGGGTPGTGGNGGLGGDATASAVVVNTSSGSATVNATANAGNGGSAADGNAGNGGVASLGTVSGSSTSGTVNVTGTIRGGNGGSVTGTESIGNAGSGADAFLTDAVDGSTTGSLTLNQNAYGGNSGNVRNGLIGITGDALSSLSKSGSFSSLFIDVDAYGGNGGTRNASSGAAAAGGSATAVSFAENDAGSARAQTDVRGGFGGAGQNGADGGRGGDVFSTATAITSGVNDNVDVDGFAGWFSSTTGGGVSSGSNSSGGDGGNSTGVSIGTATGNSNVNVRDLTASGGGGNVNSGTGSGGNAGTANSSATGSNAGTNSVTVSAQAQGRAGGTGRGVVGPSDPHSGGMGGTAIVAATGSSSGGGSVSVSATQIGGAGGVGLVNADGGAGADSTLVNGVSGSTSGQLTLNQTATAGTGGNSAGGTSGAAGDATATLAASNAGGGNITGTSTADGGNGGNGTDGSVGSDGGAATAGIDLSNTNASSVTATVNANAGTGGSATDGNAGNGGVASLATVNGSSTSGTVSVTANVNGGKGGAATGAANAGDGASQSITDGVDGSTSGALTLKQDVTGGNSGNVQNGLIGITGDALSSLSKSGSFSSLFIDIEAFGGSGGTRNASSGAAAAGGSATAVSFAENDAGSARAQTDVRGGFGGAGQNGADGGRGGDVFSTATAITSGVNDNVDVDGFAGWFSSTTGGGVSSGSNSSGGDGGNSTGVSIGTATGNSNVNVRDLTASGGGGNVNSGTGSGGNAGTANSSATGSNAGTNSVTVSAQAQGRAGGTGRGVVGPSDPHSGGMGGTAIVAATGSSSGGGSVSVSATQIGGAGGVGLVNADGGAGADSTLVNGVSGSTSGQLTLNQTATAGTGGNSAGGTSGAAGDATATLAASNAGGGNITGTSTADGGNGGNGTDGSVGSDGGAATAGIDLSNTNASSVTATVNANAGTGGSATDGNAGNGGVASLATVNGSSTSGTVSVTANVNGGKGGAATGAANAGDGASQSITDGVDGSTSGALTLKQDVTGGNSGNVQNGLIGITGDALSSLSKSGSFSSLFIDIEAFGGSGGTRNASSGAAAAGGSATAVSFAENDAGSARAQTDVRGGFGGAGQNGADGGRGGDVFSTATAITSGVNDNVDVDGFAGWFSSTTGGGVSSGSNSSGGDGGNSTGVSIGTATGNSNVNVRDLTASGGGGNVNSGTGSGGNAGTANSSATGSNAGTNSVTVSAQAQGRAGGTGRGVVGPSDPHSGGMGGTAIVAATGSSSGGGSVSVSATQIGGAGGVGLVNADGGAGADSTLVNGVSGSTSGQLTLNQTATAGTGGNSAGGTSGAAGDATATLAASNAGGGNITGTSTADGGNGGNGTDGSVGSDGGAATAGIDLSNTNASSVTATVNANAGTGGSATDGNAGNGGVASLATVNGSSTSGTVSVTANVNGGKGGAATGAANAGDGASQSITDGVDGSTSGALTLKQDVTGGNSGNVQNGLIGITGDALSSLSKSGSFSSLFIDIEAFGGSGGTRNASSGAAAAGGSATAVSFAENDAGSARAQTDVRGGFGGAGQNGADGGRGGDVFSTATAITSGVNDNVDVDGFAGWFSSTTGGGVSSGSNSSGGDGGNSTGVSIGTATGNSNVNVRDLTASGGGGNVNSGTGSGGNAGTANSSATGSNAGTNSVTVSAQAQGRAGGTGRGTDHSGGAGGLAIASATGSGGGSVSTTATAIGGNAGSGLNGASEGLGGNAFATAFGTGASGTTTANATAGQSNGNLVNDLSTTASAPLASTNIAQAWAQLSGAGFDVTAASGQQATALGYGAPADAVSLPLVLGDSVHANFDISGIASSHNIADSGQLNSDIFGIGVLGGSYSENGSGTTKTYTTTADFDVDLAQLQASNQNLLVGFINPVVTGSAFDDPNFSVRFRIFKEGTGTANTIVDETFTTLAGALAYFDNSTLDLGTVNTGVSGDLDLKFQLEVTSDTPGSGFAMDYIVGNSTIRQRAVPYVPDTTVDFGDYHVGDATLQGVEVLNVAVSGSDNADALFSGTTGDAITNSGSFTGLAPGASDATSMQVGIDTSTAGAKTGVATIELSTDGSVTGSAEVFGTADIAVLNGKVYRYAVAAIDTGQPVAFGNVHVGDVVAAQAIAFSNDAAVDGFSENLNAAVNGTTGGVLAEGSFTGLGALQDNVTDIAVNIDTATAGDKSGIATIDFVSDGNGINSLGQTALASQNVQVTGAVYRLAEATIANAPDFDFGNVRVGDPVSQALSISNTAVADVYSESLNASFGDVSDARITTNGGAISLLEAGGTDASSMVVGVDTTTAGVLDGTATINFASDGEGTSGLGITGLPSQDLAVAANITVTAFNPADPVINNAQPLMFGNFREGDAATAQLLSISNNAPDDGFSESLNADANGTTGGVIAAGSFDLLAAQATNDTDISVSIDTSTAGDKSGVATIDFESDGTGTSGLDPMALASQDVEVTGAVFRLAQGQATPDPIDFGNVRLDDVINQALAVANAAANDGFSEGLGVGASATGDASVAGVVAGLIAADGVDDSSLSVGLDTSVVGERSGTVELAFTSDGEGTSGFAAIGAGGQSIDVTGTVFRLADGQATPDPIDFGNVRLDDVISQALTVANAAANDGFSEGLGVGASATGDASVAGAVAGLIAAGADDSNLSVGLDTSVAGDRSGTVELAFTSDGEGTSGLAETESGAQTVEVTGTVFRLAQGQATPDPIDFGNVHLNDTVVDQVLTVANTAAADGFSEGLGVGAGATGDASLSGAVAGLIAAGAVDDSSLSVGLDTSVAGDRSGTVELAFTSDGEGTSGLAAVESGAQTVEVTGAVYRLAEATIANAPDFDFGNVRVGDPVSQALSISNTAVADVYSESLNASFGDVSDARITTNGGAISLLEAGGTDASSMVVGVDTTTAGVLDGTATINFASDGEGTSGLGITGLPSQDLAVAANITVTAFNPADPVINNAQPLMFGNFREGDAATAQLLSISNNAPDDGFSESLNADANGTTGGVIAAGSFDLLAAQATNDTDISVSIDTSTAGDKSGVATIDFESDGTGTSGLDPMALASQDVEVTGAVFRLAQGQATPDPIDFGNVRLDDVINQALAVANAAANDGFSEGLGVGASATGDASVAGVVAGLIAADGVDDSSLSVGLDTSVVGERSGTVELAFTSDGEGTSGFAAIGAGGQSIDVTGTVFRLADGQATPDPIDFGNVRLDDVISQALTVANAAANDGFSEGLGVGASATGDASVAGAVAGLIAAGADDSNLSVGLDTSVAGDRSGTVELAFTSDGEGTSGLAETESGAQTVEVTGTVFRLAQGQATPDPIDFGNVRLDDVISQALTVANAAANDGFSEGLGVGASVTGDATVDGAVAGLIVAEAEDNNLSVGLDTTVAGARSGTVELAFSSDGEGTSGLAAIESGAQAVEVSGTVFRLADGQATPDPIDFGNVRLDDVISQALTVANAAANDGFSEGLGVGASATGHASVAGAVAGLIAAGADDSSLSVGLDTSVAGDRAGTVELAFTSDGEGTSGLAAVESGAQTVEVAGAVFRLADGQATPDPIDFGNVRLDDIVNQALTVANAAANDGFSEGLGVGASATGDATVAGAVAGLIAASTEDSSLSVGLDTSVAGDRAGTVELAFTSDGEGTSGLAAVESGAQAVEVTGAVFRLAAAGEHSPEPVVLNARVGDTVQQALSVSNTAASDDFSESLNASLGGATGSATAAGSFSLLGAGATDNSSLVVGLDTSSSGARTGTATISLESDGAGTSDIAGIVALADQFVNVSGNVWAPAIADVQPTSLDFGIVHVGDSVAEQALAVSNIASGALTDVLQGGFGLVDGPFNGSGDLGTGVAAGDTDSNSLSVGLDTSSAGVFDGAANVGLVSHNPDLEDLSLDAQIIALTGQVNNFANPVFDFLGGDGLFSGSGDSFLLDFGDIILGSGSLLDSNLATGNDVPDPADSLDLFFDLSGVSLFSLSGFDDLFGLTPELFIDDLFVQLDTSLLGLGSFTENVFLNPVGFNDSGYRADLSPITLALQVNIVDGGGQPVPEPNTLALMLLALMLMISMTARRQKRRSA